MDTNFQTSFIPKRPLAEDRAPRTRHISLVSFIATLLFFASLVSAGGMYFYRASLVNKIASMNTSLEAARNAFEPTLINDLQRLDKRIASANTLLSTHIAVSPVFAELQANTLKSIQFTKFSYEMPTASTDRVEIQMSGKARDYTSIALESDQLGATETIHDPIFSNLTLDSRTGSVGFDLTFSVDSSLVRYQTKIATDATAAKTKTVDTTASPQGGGTTTDTSTTTPQAPGGTQ